MIHIGLCQLNKSMNKEQHLPVPSILIYLQNWVITFNKMTVFNFLVSFVCWFTNKIISRK